MLYPNTFLRQRGALTRFFQPRSPQNTSWHTMASFAAAAYSTSVKQQCCCTTVNFLIALVLFFHFLTFFFMVAEEQTLIFAFFDAQNKEINSQLSSQWRICTVLAIQCMYTYRACHLSELQYFLCEAFILWLTGRTTWDKQNTGWSWDSLSVDVQADVLWASSLQNKLLITARQ